MHTVLHFITETTDGYLDSVLTLDWRDSKVAAIKRNIELSSFRVALGNTENFTVSTSSGFVR